MAGRIDRSSQSGPENGLMRRHRRGESLSGRPRVDSGSYGGYGYDSGGKSKADYSNMKTQSDAKLSVDLDTRWQALESSAKAAGLGSFRRIAASKP